MTVLGHGIDAVDIEAFTKDVMNGGDAFIHRCFTAKELSDVSDGADRIVRLAARFAAKEAIVKALRSGFSDGVAHKDIEIGTDNFGAPSLRLTGVALKFADARGITEWEISLTHTSAIAFASVIALGINSFRE